MRLFLLLAAAVSSAAAEPFDPAPWQADLAQMRSAMAADYSNLDYLTKDRGFDLDSEFAEAARRIADAGSEEQARAAIDRLIRHIGDGHVEVNWRNAQNAAAAGAAPARSDRCQQLGFNGSMVRSGIAEHLPGYRSIGAGSLFPAGSVAVGNLRVGVIRIGLFEPQGYPALCREAIAAKSDASDDEIVTAAYGRMTRDLEGQIRAVRAAGANALMIDLSGNGGGSEWTEAAVRMMTRRPLRAARIEVIPSPAWRESQRSLAVQLEKAANGPAREQIASLANEVRRRAQPCTTHCPRLVFHGYATGLVDGSTVTPGLPPEIDSTAQFHAARGIWSGPLIVLVDDETWSAAEEFAAELQDAAAATVIGMRSGGAGCGHATGREPIVLANSKAVLKLPDCVRYRRDGSNEVRGIIPDVPVAMRQNDSPSFKAKLLAAALPRAIDAAQRH